MEGLKQENNTEKLYLQSLSILYVEDEDEVRDQLTTYLRRRCRKVYTAANGKKGLEAYQRYRPDIIVTDILMPVMDGLIMAEYIQEISSQIPIIVTTAFEEPRYFHKAIELGVQQYVNKPVKLPTLEQALFKCARTLRAEAALKEIEERYKVLFKLSHIAISVADVESEDKSIIIEGSDISQGTEGVLVDCNDAFLNLIDYQDIDELKEHDLNIYSLMTDKSAQVFNKLVKKELLVRGFSSEFEIDLLSKNNTKIPVIVQLILRYAENGKPIEIWGVMRDIRERRKAEEKLRLAAQVFESSKDAIFICDNTNKIVSVNQAFTQITGYEFDEIIGKNPKVLQSGRHDEGFYHLFWADLLSKGYWQGEIWNRRKNGETFPEWLSISLVYDHDHEISHYIAIFSDISDVKTSEAHIEFLANYDPLTQLPNRRLFIDRLDQAIKTAAREKTRLAVLFFDLDHFKTINDSLGHSIGDKMLIEVAARISDCMREIDSVSRLSGDEFAAVITDITDIGDVIKVVKKIIVAIRTAFKINDYELHVTISTGISVYPNDGENYEILLKNADTAMYCAKNSGRDSFEFFSASMSTRALERLSLEGSLRKAVENEELLIYYQPQIEVNTGRIVGMEALLRWPHAELGMISPEKFIPLAEETGLIIPIGKWVLAESCRQNKAWQDQGLVAVPIAVNVSAVQFRQHNIMELVQAALLETGLKARYLELELTESLLMDCSEYNVTLLQNFQQLGVKLSIDDFGTGYSSFSYLSRFPINKLKIDKSFCDGTPGNKSNASIVSAIISLGHDLGMVVIAEGVEEEKQLNFLEAHQCDEIQGYIFSRPVPADEMEALLKKGRIKLSN